jgi:hypothetical protein
MARDVSRIRGEFTAIFTTSYLATHLDNRGSAPSMARAAAIASRRASRSCFGTARVMDISAQKLERVTRVACVVLIRRRDRFDFGRLVGC